MKTVATTPDGHRAIALRINALHAEAEQHRSRYCDAVYQALRAAWQAGHLLLKQKRKIVHGNWELRLKLNFDGKVRTAQRYMLLAKTVPDVLQLRGLTLRQACLRLGIAVAENLHGSAQRGPFLVAAVVSKLFSMPNKRAFRTAWRTFFGILKNGPGLLPAQNAPEPAREAQNGVDSRSGILQTPKELVESPFPLRNQTLKETFCSWTRKPNSYPS